MDGMCVKMELVEDASGGEEIAFCLAGDAITIRIEYACAKCGWRLPRLDPHDGLIEIQSQCTNRECGSFNRAAVC